MNNSPYGCVRLLWLSIRITDVTDSNSPTWDNMINGQVNLYDAIRRQVDFKLNGKDYKLRTDRPLPTLIIRCVKHQSRVVTTMC